ncbi:MAG: hypothetical protein VKL59_10135 [Nostocaceae cyanobacterium]|nr:hypothetical protein [Nostocaceae cyanobacterium]
MQIVDLNHLEVAEQPHHLAVVCGRGYTQNDFIGINFNSLNQFFTQVNSPLTFSNSAAAGAKADAINNSPYPTYSFTKADTIAVTEFLGGSFSASTSVAVINRA